MWGIGTRGGTAREKVMRIDSGKLLEQNRSIAYDLIRPLKFFLSAFFLSASKLIHVVSLGDTFRNAGRQRDSDLGKRTGNVPNRRSYQDDENQAGYTALLDEEICLRSQSGDQDCQEGRMYSCVN